MTANRDRALVHDARFAIPKPRLPHASLKRLKTLPSICAKTKQRLPVPTLGIKVVGHQRVHYFRRESGHQGLSCATRSPMSKLDRLDRPKTMQQICKQNTNPLPAMSRGSKTARQSIKYIHDHQRLDRHLCNLLSPTETHAVGEPRS
jgi:hypothetical protein